MSGCLVGFGVCDLFHGSSMQVGSVWGGLPPRALRAASLEAGMQRSSESDWMKPN